MLYVVYTALERVFHFEWRGHTTRHMKKLVLVELYLVVSEHEREADTAVKPKPNKCNTAWQIIMVWCEL